MQAKQVTLRQLAREAGVSVSTVSLALRNQAGVLPKTAGKIRRLARRLGYHPHPLVSALMTYQRSAKPVRQDFSLAFVANFSESGLWRQYFSPDYINGAREHAGRHGYGLEVFWMRDLGLSGQRLSQVLYHRNISGVIVAQQPVSHGHLRLDWEKFSAVTFGYSLARPALHRVIGHQFHAMRLALRRLHKLGYRRPGYAMPAPMDNRVDNHFLGACLAEQQALKKTDRLPPLLPDQTDWNQENFGRWFERHSPDVVISGAPEVLDWLRQLGRRVPADTGFAHLYCPDDSGRFGGIFTNPKLQAIAAVDLLVGMMQRNERGVPAWQQTILVEGAWVDGETLRPQSA